jgi:LPXTG-motif cell wall-anchored protein
MRTTSLRAVGPAVGAVALATVIGAAGPAGAGNPPGNNGTVKVDGVDFDDHPDNQPHVGCTFEVDFYGFDEGENLNATVTFEAIPPTGDAVLIEDDEIFIGEDAAGGGTDLDADREYDLTDELAGIEPHPMQGWHVRLSVHADGSIGDDSKFKVFWVSGCGPTSTTSTSTPGSTTTTTKPGSTTPTSPPGSTTTTSTPGSTTSTAAGPGSSTTLPGPPKPPGAPPVAPVSGGGALPDTGSDSLPLAAAALGLVGLGAAGLFASRYVRTAGEE